MNLSAAGFAERAVNTSTVDDPIAGLSLPGLTFGEAAVNLTAAGVFGSTCEAFASAFLKEPLHHHAAVGRDGDRRRHRA